jgi:hypothetical protein
VSSACSHAAGASQQLMAALIPFPFRSRACSPIRGRRLMVYFPFLTTLRVWDGGCLPTNCWQLLCSLRVQRMGGLGRSCV